MRKLKPSSDFKGISADQLATVHESLANSTLHKTMALLSEQFGIAISYGRLQRYYHRWQQAEQIKAQSGVNISVNELIAIQNGENIPLAPIAHHLILKSACIQAGSEDNNPAQLLTLQRIANNPFNQEMAKAKHELEQRKQNLRQQLAARQAAPAAPIPDPHHTPRSNIVPHPNSPSATQPAPIAPSGPHPCTSVKSVVKNPPPFELRTLTEAPYIRDYPQISSFKNTPGQGPLPAETDTEIQSLLASL